MLEMTEGCRVSCADLLCEQYEQMESRSYIANVNAGKIEQVFRHFLDMQDSLSFFVLELPTSVKEEERLRTDDTCPSHKDVYYIDGLTKQQALVLLERYGALLTRDRFKQFGFGAYGTSAELFLQKYNIMILSLGNENRYQNFFEARDIPSTDNCITAWSTFREKTLGECHRIDADGVSSYDLLEKLQDWGIYFAERREEI